MGNVFYFFRIEGHALSGLSRQNQVETGKYTVKKTAFISKRVYIHAVVILFFTLSAKFLLCLVGIARVAIL
jgi:hypothetical protein